MPTVNNRGRLFLGLGLDGSSPGGATRSGGCLAAALPICGGCVSNYVSYSPLDPWALAPATARTRQPCAS